MLTSHPGQLRVPAGHWPTGGHPGGQSQAETELGLRLDLRLVALGKLPGLKLQARESGDDAQPKPFANRTVYFGGRPLETLIHQRDTLKPGQVVPGPAIVEQLDSTVVVTPNFAAECDPYGNLIMNRQEGAQ